MLIGTPGEVVDGLPHWFESGTADGFHSCPATLPQGIDDLAEQVIPECAAEDYFGRGMKALRYGRTLG